MSFQRRAIGGNVFYSRMLAAIVALTGAVLVLGCIYFSFTLSPVDATDDSSTNVTIPSGSSFSQVTGILRELRLIRSGTAFSIRARFTGQDRLIRAGTYALQPSMSVSDILSVLTGGAPGEVSITIPEGFTVADIDRLLASKGLTDTGAILACSKTCQFDDMPFLATATNGPNGRLEGYLFPDTYFVGAPLEPREFLGRMLVTFQKKVLNTVTFNTELHDQIVMASLSEKEAANDTERPVISGILWKRYFEGMTLGVDASVRYVLDKPTATLTKTDLEVDSPYNLRTHQGLPPGPIANPGLASIKAALHPETTPYFYYLHGTDGMIHYAETNDEHNANKAKYLR